MGPAVTDIVTSAWTLGAAVLIGVILHWLWTTTHPH
jgi:hypothetical protein